VRRSSIPLTLVLAALAVLVPSGGALAQEPAPTPSVTAAGTASVEPTPHDANSEASIRKAVEVAEDKALPRALAEARVHAARLAQLAGLTLGAIIAIDDSPQSPFGFYGPFGAYGTFGPDRYCGTVHTPRFRRDAAGHRHRVGTRTRRVCRVPRTVTSTVKVTFAAT
jgi:uncharacterized protein YggE